MLGLCTALLVLLGPVEASTRPKWLEPGFQKLLRECIVLVLDAVGIKWGVCTQLGPHRPLSPWGAG